MNATFKVGDKVRAITGTRNPDGTDFFSDGIVQDLGRDMSGNIRTIVVEWERTGAYTHHTPNQLCIAENEGPDMTDRKNHLHELDKQRTTAQEFEKYYKELRETIEAEIVKLANRVDLAIGQVWQHSTDGNFAVILGLDTKECLIKLSSGNTYPLTKITSNRSAYTYLGEMEDVISVVSE